jgi:PAS domain S-box-containing protein
MRSASGDLIPASFVLPLITGVTIAAVALTLYCFLHGISTVFMHLYYLPIILIAYFYRRRGIPVFTGLSLLYLALATFFLYPSMVDIESAVLRTGMFILIGVVVAELSERLEKKKEDYRIAHEYEKSIIENANVWLMVLDSYGRILGWNRAAEQISEYPAAEVIGGKEVWKRLYPEKNYRKEITGKISEIIKKDNYLENLQTTIVSKTGTKKTIVWNTRGLPDSEGTIGNYIAIGVDITDREKVEQVSREYAEWYSTLLRTTQDGYNLVDATGRLTEVNDNYCRMTGFSREELLGRSISDQDANESKDVAFAHMQKILATGSDRFETRHRTKGGGTIDVEVSVVLQTQKRLFIVFVRDITERKHAEMEISESEEKFHTMADFTADWEYWQGQDKQIIYMSPSCHHITGYTQQEFLSDPDLLETIVHPDDHRSVHDHNIEAWETRQALSTDFRIIHRDGTVRWIGHACRQVYDTHGKALGRRVSNRDITDQKIAAQALRESEEKFRAFFTTSRDCVFITTLDGRWEDLNDAAVELFGYDSRDELMQVNVRDLYADPGERARHVDIIRQNGFTSDFPLDLKRKDGTVINTLVTSVIRKDKNGNVVGFQGSVRDITELKRAEAALTESFATFRTVMDSLDSLVYVADMKTYEILFINQYGRKIWGDLTGGICWKSLQVNQEGPCPFCTNDKILDPEGNPNGILIWEFRNTITGQWYECHDSAIQWTDGRIVRLEIATDITDRKQVVEALRQSEEKIRTVLENVPDLILVHRNGIILYINPSSVKVMGYTQDELINKQMTDFIVPKYHPIVADAISKRMSGTTIEPYEIEILTKSGGRRTVVVGGTVIEYSGSSASLNVLTDITERKLAVDALRQANKQLNLLSSITRHDIKNQLLALSGYLEISKESLGDLARTSEFIAKEERITDTIAHQISFTKDYEELGAAAPEWQNVNASIEKALLGLPMRAVRVEIDPNNPEVFADRLFEKVFYNLIDNALRYGGAGMKTIRVSSQEIDTGLLIVCEDDGVGITVEDKKRLFTRGFGKNTGLGLFLSREILAITGITITENGIPGKGARFEITVPKGAYRFTGTGEK